MDKKNYTLELKEVISYVNDVLINEFPKDKITSEYLIMSILDHKNCHANMILDNCMTSNNLDELKQVYTDVLQKHMDTQTLSKGSIYDESWESLIRLSEDESARMLSEETGTEHVLLAVLNNANDFREKEIFQKFGLEYTFIFGKCNVPQERKQNRINPRRKIIMGDNGPTLKSQVNMKAFGFDGGDNISKYTININEMVKNGEIDAIIGRDKEIMNVIKVLARKKKNNAILVGEGGAGKTSIAFGIAKLIEDGLAPSIIDGKEIVMLDIYALISGTSLRGMFEERVKKLFDELKGSDRYILLIDDIHNAIKSGSKEKDMDISGMLGDILSNGNVRVIATTTFKEYRNAIETNASISRKFQKITVEPTSIKTTIEILEANKHLYEDFHNVTFSSSFIEKCVTMADRYITDRKLPDSALDIIDLCGAKASVTSKESPSLNSLKKRLRDIQNEKSQHLNNGEFELIDSLNIEEDVVVCDIAEEKRRINGDNSMRKEMTEADMLETVSEMTGVPVQKLNTDEKKRLANINNKLRESVVGQDEAIDTICNVIKRNRVGLGDKSKALGVFLLAGKTGVGKSLIAKKLAEEIFGDEKALVRIDMSEYSEKSSVSKLLGASPGYIGYENGGQLTEAVKRKQYCVLLLDEIEKADQEVHNIFLQLFDDGRLTDASGQIVNFKNVIVLMTSNVGARRASELGGGVGFNKNESENSKVIIDKEIRKKFTPEFINRIDKIVHFNDLTEDNLKDIVKLELNKLRSRLNNIKYNINFDNNIIDLIYKEAIKSKEYGARPILRLVQDLIEDKLTELMLTNEYPPSYEFHVWCEGDEVKAV